MRLLLLLLFGFLPLAPVHADERRFNQERQKRLKSLDPYETMTLTPGQVEELEFLGTVTLEPEQWRHFRDEGISCPKRFDTVVPLVGPEWHGFGTGDTAIALTPATIAIFRHGTREETTRLFKLTVDKAADKEAFPSYVTLRVDRRGQFYCGGRLVPYQTLLDTIRSSLPKPDQYGTKPRIEVNIPLGMTCGANALKTRLGMLGRVAKQAGWDAFVPNSEADPGGGTPGANLLPPSQAARGNTEGG